MTEPPKCQDCGKKAKELFEKLINGRVKWVCNNCKPLVYNRVGSGNQLKGAKRKSL